jgi:hypothetical protein
VTVPAEPPEALAVAATVRVEAVDWLGRARTGLGVVVGSEGRVLVPTRVVAHAETLRLTFADGISRQDVGVVWVDRARDLALLALDRPCAGLPEERTPSFGPWGPSRGLRRGGEAIDAALEDLHVDIQWVQAHAAAVAVTHTFSRNATGPSGRLAGTPRTRARGNLAVVLDEHDWAGWAATRILANKGLLVFHLVKGSYRRTLTESCDQAGARCSLTLTQEATPPAG